MIDHITIHVPPGTLATHDLSEFFSLLGCVEIDANDPFEHGYNVRWFSTSWTGQPNVHLVEADDLGADRDSYALGHLCFAGLPPGAVASLRQGRFLRRDSGSGRFWVGLANIRVEVRP